MKFSVVSGFQKWGYFGPLLSEFGGPNEILEVQLINIHEDQNGHNISLNDLQTTLIRKNLRNCEKFACEQQ